MQYIVSRQLTRGLKPAPARFMQQRTLVNTTHQQQQQPPPSRIKQFMKKYGYVGIGVYVALGTVDLAATMAIISVKGADRVREAEDYVIGKAKGWIGMEHTPLEQGQVHEKPSFTSLFVIAYGIHKTILLPFRLSLTAAVTPTVARKLMNWGWFKNAIQKGVKK